MREGDSSAVPETNKSMDAGANKESIDKKAAYKEIMRQRRASKMEGVPAKPNVATSATVSQSPSLSKNEASIDDDDW